MLSKVLVLLVSVGFAFPAEAVTKIACIGDSITYTAATRANIPYPHRLEMTLNSAHPGEYVVANFGVSATTSSQHLTTWTNSIRNKGYDILVIISGVNDLAAGTAGATVWTNVDTIVTQALADGMTVVLFTTLPWKGYTLWTADKQTETDALLTSIRARSGVTLIDLYPSWETAPGSDIMLSEYDVGDGLHPNSTGSDALAAAVHSALGL